MIETFNGLLSKNYANSQMMKQSFLIYVFLPLILFMLIFCSFLSLIKEAKLNVFTLVFSVISISLLLITLFIQIVCTIHIFLKREVPVTTGDKARKIEFISCVIMFILCICSSISFAQIYKDTEERIIFALSLQILLIYCINNLLYFSIPLSITAQGVVAIVFTGCMIGFLSLGIRSTLMVATVMLYVIFQNYNVLNFNDSCLVNINNLESDSHLIAQLSVNIDSLNVEKQQLMADKNNLISQNSNLLNEQQIFISESVQNTQKILDRARLNQSYLQSQVDYLNLFLNMIQVIENQMYEFGRDPTDPFFFGYTPRVESIINEIYTLMEHINIFLNTFQNASNIPQSSIDELQNRLDNLFNMQDFQRCQLYFNQPTYTWDCGQFNLFYELMAKIFCNFFRNWSIPNWPVGGYGSNEQVLRGIIMYAKNTPAAYDAFTPETKAIVDRLYTYIDGPALWQLLGGDLTLDNSTAAMNNRIANETMHYLRARAGNGAQYFDLLAQLALRQDFFSYFDWYPEEFDLQWGSVRQLVYVMRIAQPLDTFGFVKLD